MMLDQTTLLLGMAIAVLLAVLAAFNLATYVTLGWLGWPGAAGVAYTVAERLVVAAVAVAVGTYFAAALVPWGVLQ